MNFDAIGLDLQLAPHLLAGMAMGFSLIIAIGAQNIFLLRQGIIGRHVLPVVLFCAVSDALLIMVGVSGMGKAVESVPGLVGAIRWAGVIFLLVYAWQAARRAVKGEALVVQGAPTAGLWPTMATIAALTWLNPHVYLDTVLLLGSISAAHQEPGRWYFGAGAVLASFLWFAALGFGARLLVPLFEKALAWRIMDSAIAVVLLGIAVQLALMPL